MLAELQTLSCNHFGLCGGCTCPVQTAEGPTPSPYPEEALNKETRVRTLLQGFDVETWLPFIPAPEMWYHRNKMEYAFGQPSDPAAYPLVLGLRQTGRFDRIVDVETCLLMSPQAEEILRRTRQWALDHGLKGYHRKAHQGDLRYLVLREGKNTGQRMAILIATPGVGVEPLTDLVSRLGPLLTTFWLGTTDAHGDVARAEDMRLLQGPEQIEDTILDIRYRISPYSFFQTNTHATAGLYRLLQDWGQTVGGGVLLDMYCGSGGITLSLAKSFDRVIGVDSNTPAITDARLNAELNGLQNAEFVAEDAAKFAEKLPGSKVAVQLSAVVVDPPRPGLHPKALQSLLELNPPHMAYVSCNPESLARDLQPFVPFYKIKSVQAVDLFPHTPHVETLVTLEHR